TALLAASSERNELEQTSSASPSVRCASVMRAGRISCSTTGTPDLATCQAASEPARPAPITCTMLDWGPVMGRTGSAFRRCVESPRLSFLPPETTTPARGGRYRFVRVRAERYQP